MLVVPHTIVTLLLAAVRLELVMIGKTHHGTHDSARVGLVEAVSQPHLEPKLLHH